MVKIDLFPENTAPVSHFKVLEHTQGASTIPMKLYRDGVDTNIIVKATPYEIHTPNGVKISGEERTKAIFMAGKLCKAYA